MNIVKDYKHNNQTLFFDETKNTYVLISYNTEVFEIKKNGEIILNGHGKFSNTTSKHITQAHNYLRFNDLVGINANWHHKKNMRI